MNKVKINDKNMIYQNVVLDENNAQRTIESKTKTDKLN